MCLWVHAGGQRRNSNVTSYFPPFLRQALFIISHSISQALNIPGILPSIPLVPVWSAGIRDLYDPAWFSMGVGI